MLRPAKLMASSLYVHCWLTNFFSQKEKHGNRPTSTVPYILRIASFCLCRSITLRTRWKFVYGWWNNRALNRHTTNFVFIYWWWDQLHGKVSRHAWSLLCIWKSRISYPSHRYPGNELEMGTRRHDSNSSSRFGCPLWTTSFRSLIQRVIFDSTVYDFAVLFSLQFSFASWPFEKWGK